MLGTSIYIMKMHKRRPQTLINMLFPHGKEYRSGWTLLLEKPYDCTVWNFSNDYFAGITCTGNGFVFHANDLLIRRTLCSWMFSRYNPVTVLNFAKEV